MRSDRQMGRALLIISLSQIKEILKHMNWTLLNRPPLLSLHPNTRRGKEEGEDGGMGMRSVGY